MGALFSRSGSPRIGFDTQQLLVLANHVLDVIALTQLGLKFVQSLVENGIQGRKETVIEGGEQMVENMITEMGEHQKL